MQLISAQITDYRSVEDSEEFAIDQITCLVGKNEAGKSAILQALATLNPHPRTPQRLEQERDYPARFLNDYKIRHPDADAIAVITRWRLSTDEVGDIEKVLGEHVLETPEVSICRRYNSKDAEWNIPLNRSRAIQNLLNRFAIEPDRVGVDALNDIPELAASLNALSGRTENEDKLLAHVQSLKSAGEIAVETLTPHLPTFMYFSSYDRMASAATIDQLKSAEKKEPADDHGRSLKLFADFFAYANVSLKDVAEAATFESFNSRLRAASNSVTEQIFDYWSQNAHLDVVIRVDHAKPGDKPPLNEGFVARARINNSLHKADTAFSERSAGFVWFFSFLVKFGLIERERKPVVLLLDEPGLTLHGKAQADLLRYFDEKLSPNHQVIYSTHSPFMVPSDRLLSCRVVEDIVETNPHGRVVPIGTKVSAEVLSKDKDTVFPLQGALGYEITQSLFVGKHTLLVEGPSDILYLKAVSHELRLRGRIALDSRWTICPAGGIDKIQGFVSLFGGNNLHVAVLTDYQKGDRNKLENLRKTQILKTDHIHSVAEFTGSPEADVEDLFNPELFINLVKSATDRVDLKGLAASELAGVDQNVTRIIKRIERVVGNFDHYEPAAWLIEHASFLQEETDAVLTTLKKFEDVFKTFNSLLPQS